MSSRPATPWLRGVGSRPRRGGAQRAGVRPSSQALSDGPAPTLQIIHAPEGPSARHTCWPVSTQATSRCVWVFLEAEVVHSYFWALGTQPGQVHSSRELWVVTQAGSNWFPRLEDTWCS